MPLSVIKRQVINYDVIQCASSVMVYEYEKEVINSSLHRLLIRFMTKNPECGVCVCVLCMFVILVLCKFCGGVCKCLAGTRY